MRGYISLKGTIGGGKNKSSAEKDRSKKTDR